MTDLPRGLLLFDTSVYIGQIRHGRYPWLTTDGNIFPRTIMTAVVAAELAAGCRTRDDRLSLAELCRAHAAHGKLSYPPLEGWMMVGSLLHRYSMFFGAIRFADHFRDALIAVESSRHSATLVTENYADFKRWSRLLRSSRRPLYVFGLDTASP